MRRHRLSHRSWRGWARPLIDAQAAAFSTGLEVPRDLALLPEGRMLVTERPGRVRLVEQDGSVRAEPVARVEVSVRGEGGLLGLDLDPQFARGQRFAYLIVRTAQGMQVQRWRVGADAWMTRDAVVLGGIRAGAIRRLRAPAVRAGRPPVRRDG